MTYREKERIREDIWILRELEKILIEKGVPRRQCLEKLEKHKRRIRQTLKDIYERDEQKEIVFGCDEYGESWIVKEWYDCPFTEEDKKEYIESEWIRINSPFDCTGLGFTRWIRIFNVDTSFGKRAVVYHAIGLDV